MSEIIFEHPDYLIVNKPAGLLTHKDLQNKETKTLADFLLEKYPEIKGVGETLKINFLRHKTNENLNENKENNFIEIYKPGIVHRLDKDTSGVMIVARNQKSYIYFKSLFKNRKIEKTYHAFVYENIKEDEFNINEPIGRNKINFKQRQAGKNARGKMREAETYFRILKRSPSKKYTLLEAKPKTGRTHQIRAHLKFIYKPIVSDEIYAQDRKNDLGFKRLALHSYKISFISPENVKMEFKAPYPPDFKVAKEKLLLL